MVDHAMMPYCNHVVFQKFVQVLEKLHKPKTIFNKWCIDLITLMLVWKASDFYKDDISWWWWSQFEEIQFIQRWFGDSFIHPSTERRRNSNGISFCQKMNGAIFWIFKLMGEQNNEVHTCRCTSLHVCKSLWNMISQRSIA